VSQLFSITRNFLICFLTINNSKNESKTKKIIYSFLAKSKRINSIKDWHIVCYK